MNGKEDDNSKTYVEYWYVDNEVTLTGSGISENYSMSLNKGWNRVYVMKPITGKDLVSTNSVDGLKWYFYEN